MSRLSCVRCRRQGTLALRLEPQSVNEGVPMCPSHHGEYRKERGW